MKSQMFQIVLFGIYNIEWFMYLLQESKHPLSSSLKSQISIIYTLFCILLAPSVCLCFILYSLFSTLVSIL